MKKLIQFTKMSGAGNDFVVINNMGGSLHVDTGKLAVALCSRHFGIGADGLLLVEPSLKADFFMRYFNADGSYGGMCGNGGRCIARYAYLNGLANSRVNFEALDHLYVAEVFDNSVKLQMKEPKSFHSNIKVETTRGIFYGEFIDTGSPHFVVDSPDISSLDIELIGKEVRFNPQFAPNGCNVNFVQELNERELSVRTYERGVEAETLACGTGSVASAIITAKSKGMKSPVTVNVKSGERLVVHFDNDGIHFTNVLLQGSAHLLFSGQVFYDTDHNVILDSSENPTTQSPINA